MQAKWGEKMDDGCAASNAFALKRRETRMKRKIEDRGQKEQDNGRKTTYNKCYSSPCNARVTMKGKLRMKITDFVVNSELLGRNGAIRVSRM